MDCDINNNDLRSKLEYIPLEILGESPCDGCIRRYSEDDDDREICHICNRACYIYFESDNGV